MSVSPINNIDISECGKFVECWNNGNRCRTIYIRGRLTASVEEGRNWFREWTGYDASLGKKLSETLLAIEGSGA